MSAPLWTARDAAEATGGRTGDWTAGGCSGVRLFLLLLPLTNRPSEQTSGESASLSDILEDDSAGGNSSFGAASSESAAAASLLLLLLLSDTAGMDTQAETGVSWGADTEEEEEEEFETECKCEGEDGDEDEDEDEDETWLGGAFGYTAITRYTEGITTVRGRGGGSGRVE